jgi:general secretion pathway protein J
VAIALFSLLTVALSGSMHLGIKAWARNTAYAARTEHLMLAQNVLRRAIADAYPYYVTTDPTHPSIDFDGSRTALSLLAATPMALGGHGRSRFTFSVAPQRNGGAALVIMSRPELIDPSDVSHSINKILVDRIDAAEFSYLGETRFGDTTEWRDEWHGATTLPRLVRIRIRFSPDDERRWPDLVVAPHITADVGCIYDLLTKHCRGR